ncbi:MAG: hypothetical protein LAO18_22770 [Acidobacteriia bacterium]|nr:hypothetical protein [Terriglobia bacterium]
MRHLLSRISSDIHFPKINAAGFLAELRTMLALLNRAGARSYVFFRRCTLPSRPILDLLDTGAHQIGLHLENSRSFSTFIEETQIIEHHIGRKVLAVSKHGSGGAKFGFHHYAPYEPEKYVEWLRQASMRLFLGNLEDPSLERTDCGNGLLVFPSAFWLEPPWRDTKRFTLDWLLRQASKRDIVLLVHPENVLADPELVADFRKIINTVESRVFHD